MLVRRYHLANLQCSRKCLARLSNRPLYDLRALIVRSRVSPTGYVL